MGALQTVFETITAVIDMIKNFLKELGLMKGEDETPEA